MGRRVAFAGLVMFLALILYTSLSVATTLDGCQEIMTRIVCEPGASVVLSPI